MFNFFKKNTTEFCKVSYDQFKLSISHNLQTSDDINALYNDEKVDTHLQSLYRNIILPTRATKHSAGYDMYLPFDISLKKGESIVIPTGIRAKMDKKTVLLALPKSGLGTKYRTSLANTVGVIDADYFYSANEGHIFMKVVFDGFENEHKITINKNGDNPIISTSTVHYTEDTLKLKAGSKFCQLIFVPFKICSSDNLRKGAVRNGGLGSTGV